MLKKLKQRDESSEEHLEIEAEPDQEQERELTTAEMITAEDMEFDLEVAQDDELNEVAFIVDNREIKIIGENGEEVVDIDENDIENEIENEGLY